MRGLSVVIAIILSIQAHGSSGLVDFLCGEDFEFESERLKSHIEALQRRIRDEVTNDQRRMSEEVDNFNRTGFWEMVSHYDAASEDSGDESGAFPQLRTQTVFSLIQERLERRESGDCFGSIIQRDLTSAINQRCRLGEIEQTCDTNNNDVIRILTGSLNYDKENTSSAYCAMDKAHEEANEKLHRATGMYKSCLQQFENKALNNPECRSSYADVMTRVSEAVVMECSAESLDHAYSGFKSWIEGPDSPVQSFCRSVEAYRAMRIKTIEYGARVAQLRGDIDRVKQALFGALRKPASLCTQTSDDTAPTSSPSDENYILKADPEQ